MATTVRSSLIPTQIPSDFRMVSMLDAAYFEDLPAYTPRRARDVDTLSVYSAAPSYRSEPPNYNDVEPLAQEAQYTETSYSQETSFFNDAEEDDDIIMTEVVIPATVADDEEPTTPTQTSVDAEAQAFAQLFPVRPPTPVRRRPALLPTVPRRAVPQSPTASRFSQPLRSPRPTRRPQPVQQSSLLDIGESAAGESLQRTDSAESSQSQDDDFEARGLPRMSWAPGFRPLDAFSAANYCAFGNNLANIQRNPVRKQYENVARRRVRFQEDPIVNEFIAFASPVLESFPINDIPELTRDDSPRNSRDNTPQPPSPRTPTATMGSSPSTSRSTTAVTSALRRSPPSPTTETVRIRPEEDPELVGEVAAEQARKQREYRELMTTDSARALELESRGWDFMLSQSRDWEERQLSWSSFRQSRMQKEMQRRNNGGGTFGGALLRIVSRG